MPKYFIITVDTEGDNMWRDMFSLNSVKNRITISNGKYLPRFQSLCERYGLIPTYLVNYEMSFSTPLQDMAREKKQKLEIGMHMHSWSCPPWHKLSGGNGNPYSTEYPEEVIRQKTCTLTDRLEETFHRDITSTRNGRWAFDDRELKIISELGYIADCSVTPGIDWKDPGQTKGSRGPDYRNYRKEPYNMMGKLYEIPVTICDNSSHKVWLRPNGHNLTEMKWVVDKKCNDPYLEFMIHSSELMPFGSPNFRSEMSIESLYRDMDELFRYVNECGYKGIALSNYARLMDENR